VNNALYKVIEPEQWARS